MNLDLGTASFSVTVQGEGVPVVFLHAGVADSRMWREQVAAVTAAGYRAITYDRRGFGRTVVENEPFSHVEDLEALLGHLEAGPAVLVGCSQGGRVAMDFALAHPDRAIALVLVSSAVSGAPEATDFPPEIDPLLTAYEMAESAGDADMLNRIEAHAWLDGPATAGGRVGGPLRELFLEMNGIALRHPPLTAETAPPSAYERIPEIEQPTLLISGELDFPHIVARHDHLEASMPNAFAAMIEDAAHLPSFEKPELFNRLLLEFLDALFGAPAA